METPEMIFNLYYFYSSSDLVIREIGCTTHTVLGSDESKLDHLRKNCETDLTKATKFPVPSTFTIARNGSMEVGLDLEKFEMMATQGYDALVFEPIYKHYNASKNPLILQTPVRDGIIVIDATADIVQAKDMPFSGIHNIKIDDKSN